MNKEPDRLRITHLMKIGIGNLWMFSGLLTAMKKAKEK